MRQAIILAFVGSVAVVAAQAPVEVRRFEVASVRPNNTATGMTVGISGDSMRLTGVTARNLIVRAYGVEPFEIIGGPDWLSARRFDVVAKAPAPASVAQMNLMLRPLLAERFKLVARVEQRELPVFFLVTAREDGRLGPGLKPAPNADCGRREATAARSPEQCRLLIGSGVLEGAGQPLHSLTTALEKIVGRPVVDMTNLTGTYDFTLTYAPDAAPLTVATDPASRTSDAPSVYTALEEQLGLRLDRQRGPVDVVVIDSVEMPTPD